MNFKKLALATTVFAASLVASAHAANGSWTQISFDKVNGFALYGISTTTANFSTPPLPLNWPGSQVAVSVAPISGTVNVSTSIWGTLGLPIGASATVINNSATIIGVVGVSPGGVVGGEGGSLTVVTTNNNYHDIGVTTSQTAGPLINIRAFERRQNVNTQYQ